MVFRKERIDDEKRFLMHRITLALALGALVFPGCVWALPQGGTVVTGNGSYTAGSDKMDITGSGNMSVKWDSFNVADNEAVNFKGMNAILNYVTGKQGSEIYGALNGEGVHVFLINPNGVLFGKTAQVNVGVLTVSTKTLADVDGTLQNFKSTGTISAFGTAGDAVLINMGKLEADTLHFEGSRIILDTDNVTLGGNGFDGSRAVINGDYANDNVILGYTAYEDGSYAGKDKTFAVNDGAQQVNGYMWVEDAAQLQDINTNLKGNYALKNDIDAGVIANFVPIGNDSSFKGIFDGLDNSIKNVTVNGGNGNYKGLFSKIANVSTVKNFVLANCKVNGYQAIGTIVGQNDGSIENVTVNGTVSGTSKYTGDLLVLMQD
ncbi:MAG: filamentous hemagglutinin N-terminal domain-containing protein [Acidaminococcaceae bacterium]|nr:filamentous hemagglutinin N-terminal domain-containing protein [Acidaminococcaceae bacterium]